jgi:hypothetical protein
MWPATVLSDRPTRGGPIEGAESGILDTNLGFCHRCSPTDRLAIALRESSGHFLGEDTKSLSVKKYYFAKND